MDRQPAAIYIIRLFTQKIEKLGIAHGNQEVKGIVCITHNEEQRCFPVSQSVQLQLVIGGNFPQFCNIKYGKPRTTGNQDRLSGFSRDKLSRTF